MRLRSFLEMKRRNRLGFAGFLILGIVAVLLTQPTFAKPQGNLTSLFYEGNSYYEKGDYAQAVTKYEQVIKEGYASGQLYYNLANAYYRQGEKGMALVNYLRARTYIPRDPDLRSNLEYLQKDLALDATQISGGIQGWVDWLNNYFTVGELTFWASLFLTVVVALILLQMYLPRMRNILQIPLIVASLVLVLTILVTGISGYQQYYTKTGFIVDQGVTARFEPAETGEAHFTLSLGTRVEVGSRRGDWITVERNDGKKGWVKISEVERLHLVEETM